MADTGDEVLTTGPCVLPPWLDVSAIGLMFAKSGSGGM